MAEIKSSFTWVDRLPSYASMLITLGSLMFGGGVLYSNVAGLKVQVDELNTSASKCESLITRVNILQMEVDKAEQSQDKFASKLDAITDGLGQIQIGVARLEERLTEREAQKKK